MTTPKSTQSIYRDRIAALAQTKLEFNAAKLAHDGYHDVDDHGNIPWPDPIPFERVSNHADGGSYGARCIGQNFRRWLEAHPVYIHPQSALAGRVDHARCPASAAGGRRIGPTHLAPLHEKYHFMATGIGAMNHIGPDMKIGLELGWGGLLSKIRYYRAQNRPADTAFYDAEEDFVLGVQDWIRRHVAHARALAAAETDPGHPRQLPRHRGDERAPGERRAAQSARGVPIPGLVPGGGSHVVSRRRAGPAR